MAHHNEYEIDVYKLIHATKDLPVEEIGIHDVKGELDSDCWTDANNKKITPRVVIDVYKTLGFEKAVETYPQYDSHLRQIRSADYSHPILLFQGKIIDGMHRLAKAMIDGQQTLKTRVIHEMPTNAVINVLPREK